MKNWLKFTLFSLILSIVLVGLDIFVFTGEMKNSHYKQFFEEEENSLDLIFVGNSTVRNGIIPNQIWNDYNLTAFNVTNSPSHPEVIVLAIDEIARLQNPELVFIDITGLAFQNEDIQKTYVEEFVGAMPNSAHKEEIKSRYEYFDGEKELFANHNDYRNPEYFNNKAKQNKYLKGFTPKYGTIDVAESTIQLDNTVVELPNDGKKYLKKILDTCAKYPEINFVFGRMPRVITESSVQETYALRSAIPSINEYGYDYLELEQYYDEIGLVSNEDFDDVIHMNYYGAVKFTKFIIPFLKEKYEIGNREHTDSVKENFNKSYKDYHSYMKKMTEKHNKKKEKSH